MTDYKEALQVVKALCPTDPSKRQDYFTYACLILESIYGETCTDVATDLGLFN